MQLKKSLAKYNRKVLGFSLLEVLITAAIIGIITSVVAVKYGSFNNVVLLKNQAYEVALDLREAQVFAVSSSGRSDQFREDYGVYFDMSNPQQYIFFQDQGDTIENGRNVAYYDSSLNEIIGLPRNIDSRFKLVRICVNIVSSTDLCPTELNDLAITFKRPDFDSQFASVDGKSRGVGVISNARLEYTNALQTDSNIRTVIVSSVGQIEVQ